MTEVISFYKIILLQILIHCATITGVILIPEQPPQCSISCTAKEK